MEALPRTVDRYELQAVLGSGAFATVYRARHVHTQQPVAVKLLTRASGVDRWLAEARSAAAVQHRNVVRVLDCGREGDDVFIVMELVEAPTLAEVIAHGALSVPRAVSIALQLLEGLSAAHACGVVHRDIKPPNILLVRAPDGTDLPKILDFGVSKQLTEISQTLDGSSIGTPAYMAPELFGSAKHADARVDVYAVAATLYEMLSGKLPFGANTYEELVVQVATQSPVPLLAIAPHIPIAVASAVDRGLAQRDYRFASAEDFAMALRGALVGTVPSSPHGFEPTLDAQVVPRADSNRGSVRTAPPPPPIVTTASRREMQSHVSLAWVVAAIGGLVAICGVAALATWRVQASRVDAAKETASAATLTEAPTRPEAVVTIRPRAVETQAVTLVGDERGVKFKFPPEVVGAVRATAVDALAQGIVVQAQRCRPDHGRPPIVARVQLIVRAEGTIAIAQPATEPGDQDAAKCLAALFKDAASPQTFSPGGGGVVTVEAKLDPR